MYKTGILSFGIFAFLLINLSYIYADSNNTNSVSALLNYPSQVNSGEEFSVNVVMNNFPIDIYDVRIGIMNNATRISRIWNGSSWQSSYYYVNNVIDNSKSNSQQFKLNITSCHNGIADIDFKLKDSKDKYYSFSNYTINVIGNCSRSMQITNTSNSINNNSSGKLSLRLSMASYEMKNGGEISATIRAINLEDKNYDVKVYIYDKNDKVLSQVYYDNNWLNSNNYIDDLFKGPGDKSQTVKLRIKSEYESFSGIATVGVRIREQGSSIYKLELKDSLDILEGDNNTESDDVKDGNVESQSTIESENDSQINTNEILEESEVSTSGNTIRLGKSESIKSNKNIVYKSKNELIKEYSIFGFIVLIVIFLGLLVFFRFRNKKW